MFWNTAVAKKVYGAGLFILFVAGIWWAFLQLGFGGGEAKRELFVVSRGAEQADIFEDLETQGYIKNTFVFRLGFPGEMAPGGYMLSKKMSVFQLAREFRSGPDLVWVTIPEGLRKEQIAGILADRLGWGREEEIRWVTHDTAADPDLVEGVYFPDTYLIPLSEPGPEVAERMRRRFNQVFSPYTEAAEAENIKWTTLVKIASLVQREAAGEGDMPLIAGVIWNRLLAGMKLDIDATVQYAVDTYAHYDVDARDWETTYTGRTGEEKEWWGPIAPADKNIDAIVNTYRYAGLPSRPIANPGDHALRAALHPRETDCFYYLHDAEGAIHCASTYKEHLSNIERYLR